MRRANSGGDSTRRRTASQSSGYHSADDGSNPRRRSSSSEDEAATLRRPLQSALSRGDRVACVSSAGRRRNGGGRGLGGRSERHLREKNPPWTWWCTWLALVAQLLPHPLLFDATTSIEKLSAHNLDTSSKVFRDLLGAMFEEPESFQNPDFQTWMEETKVRPPGLRWRDDASLAQLAFERQNNPAKAFPLLTERPFAGTSTARSDPSIEDIELIDVLWRGDIDAEKGSPAEQEQRDLQLLTEKSLQAPLTLEETSRFEALSKGFYEDFYLHSSCSSTKAAYPGQQNATTPPRVAQPSALPIRSSFPELKRDTHTPTDEDLNALWEATDKDGDLDQLIGSERPPVEQTPLMHGNVSLGAAISYNASNLTDIDYLVREREHRQPEQYTATGQADLSMQQPSEMLSQNESSPWFADNRPTRADMTPSFIARDVMGNMSLPASIFDARTSSLAATTVTTAPPLNVGPSRGVQTGASSRYYEDRVSFSNDSSSVASSSSLSPISRSLATSPHYNSETENVPVSRLYGKLLPHPSETDYSRHSRRDWQSSSSAVVSTASLAATSGVVRRTRGRQSKDEKLAAENNLPVTAARITEMSLAELQKITKDPKLTDEQRALIRKIRRRGKNKVAARTCRRRRGEKETSLLRPHHVNMQDYNPEEAARSLYR